MELWVHRARIEGLRLWLSGRMRIQVSLASLELLNQQLSACGFALHKDLDKNYIFRVMYSGCFVQLQHGSYVIELNLLKRIQRFGGRSHHYVMKCPTLTSPPNREHIQCDPDVIQVTRQVPLDSWNKELEWSLALRGNLVVAVEDASLIRVNVELRQSNITVQGRRREILRPVLVMETKGDFLPLKLVSGHYAYSMEATCPDVSRSVTEMTVLHIFKRRMGLTKRGGYENETLSISSVAVNQTDKFTWSENSEFVQLVIPTSVIQHNKSCTGGVGEELLQPFFRVDVVLSFKETNHKMHWTMENTLPCMRSSSPSFLEPQRSSTLESPLPVFPTQSLFIVDLHSKPLTPAPSFTETLLKEVPSLTTAPGQTIATSAMSVTSQFHLNQEPASTIAAKRTENQSFDVKSGTTLKTSQAFTSKQQPNTNVTVVSSSPVGAENTDKAQTMNQTSAGTGQTLDKTLSQQYDPQVPSSTMIHQSLQEFSASEEQAGHFEVVLTTPAITVKRNIAVTSRTTHNKTTAFTDTSSLEYMQKTHGPRYTLQMDEQSSNILSAHTNPVNQEPDKSISKSPQTITEASTSEEAPTNAFRYVSQPVIIGATQRQHETMMSSAQTTDPTRKSITDLLSTLQFQSSTVSHQSTQVFPSSAFTTEKVQTSEAVSPTLASHTPQTELRKGTSSTASPHVPGTYLPNITKLILQVTAPSDQSTTPTRPPAEQLHPDSSTPESPKTLVPSHSSVTREPDVRPTDISEILHTSTLAGNTAPLNTDTQYDRIVEKERSTVPPFSQLTTLDRSMHHRSEMTTEGLLYGNTGQAKDTNTMGTQQWTSPVEHQSLTSPQVYYTRRPALTAVQLSDDQSSGKTTSTSTVISKAFVSEQVPSSKAPVTHHQPYVLQTKTMDSSQTQATSAPAQTPNMTWSSHSLQVTNHSSSANIPKPQRWALSTPSQPEEKEVLIETVPTAPSNLTAQAEISINARASSTVPLLSPQPLKGNVTDKPAVANNLTAVTEKPVAHINISVPISQFHP
ncbi:uncharacterized protein C1orf127 homolog isoform X2 [Clupea harengus]|nr:uncharacterized protein C1orf127 homolog isoform X2 [Clupea harengus]